MGRGRNIEEEKRLAAERSIESVRDGMFLGIGTGSTVAYLIALLAQKVKAGLSIRAVATSKKTEELARAAGIEMVEFDGSAVIDLTIDGADEINDQLDLIKGGGGALLREKIVAAASKREIIIADSQKAVAVLGAAALPVEVIRLGWKNVQQQLERLGCSSKLRVDASGAPFITDENNYIVDCHFGEIREPALLGRELDHIVGVVEHGLFINLADQAIIATGNTIRTIEHTRE
jgi:ribose 5-phosphate isomerase A